MRLLPRDLFDVEHRLDGGPNRDGNGWGTYSYTAAPNVPPIGDLSWGFIVHTTETAGVPGYGGGVHPHYSYLPRPHYRFIQHLYLDRRAGTLSGSSTVEGGRGVPTNRANVHQLEIIAYSSWTIAAKYGRLAVRDLNARELADIAALIRWHHQTFAPESPFVWYPKPAGNRSHPMPHRLWTPADGRRSWYVADHATAPDASTHWDSDDVNRDTIMLLATGQPPEEGDEMLYPREGDTGDRVRELQTLLNQAFPKGDALIVDGIFGGRTKNRVAKWQERAGIIGEAGWAGPTTMATLTARKGKQGPAGPQGEPGPQGPPGGIGEAVARLRVVLVDNEGDPI